MSHARPSKRIGVIFTYHNKDIIYRQGGEGLIKICLVDNNREQAEGVKLMVDAYFASFTVKHEVDIVDCKELISPQLWLDRGYDLAVFNISDRCGRSQLMEYSVEVRRLCRKTKVIFVSDELNSVLDTFDYDPDYFIHMPQSDERFSAAMEHLLKLDANKGANGLVLNTKQAKHIIPHSSIVYIEHYQHKSKIVCEDKEVTCHEKLSTLLEQLDSASFVRCHCSFVANLEHVRKYTRTQLFMSNGDILPCSRGNQSIVRKALDQNPKVKI